MRFGQSRPIPGVGVETVLVIALAARIEHAAAGQDIDRGALVRLLQEADHDRGRRFTAADHAHVLSELPLDDPLVKPVTASIENAWMLLRLAGDRDRGPGAGVDDAVSRDRFPGLD